MTRGENTTRLALVAKAAQASHYEDRTDDSKREAYRSAMSDLVEAVTPLVVARANKRLKGRVISAIDADDSKQSFFVKLPDLVTSFDASRGQFLTHIHPWITQVCQREEWKFADAPRAWKKRGGTRALARRDFASVIDGHYTQDRTPIYDVHDLDQLSIWLEQLPPDEREVIVRRYGLDGNPPQLLREVAAVNRFQRSWAERLQKRGLESLRALSRGEAIQKKAPMRRIPGARPLDWSEVEQVIKAKKGAA
jgi:RNA polymerase sigma factor (sigma-70 family)